MSETSDSPHLQLLAQDGPVMCANLSGASNPVIILDDRMMDRLAVQCREAMAQAEAMEGAPASRAALELCATLDGVVKLYEKVRNTYYAGLGPERAYAAAERELADAMRAVEAFHRPK